jgi:hypothetical protein
MCPIAELRLHADGIRAAVSSWILIKGALSNPDNYFVAYCATQAHAYQ